MDEDRHHILLKKINTKMGWGLFLLVCITLNTCSLGDNLADAARDLKKSESVDEYFNPEARPAVLDKAD